MGSYTRPAPTAAQVPALDTGPHNWFTGDDVQEQLDNGDAGAFGAFSFLFTALTTQAGQIATLTTVTVQSSSPVGGGLTTVLVFDDTLVTGGLYGWNGGDYVKIGGPL